MKKIFKLILFIVTACFILNSCAFAMPEYYIFADIEDFLQIEENYSDEIEI